MKQPLLIITLLALHCLISCTSNKDHDYFNGNITHNKSVYISDTLSLQPLNLNGIFAGRMVAADSMCLFLTYNDPEFFIYLFNYHTGELINKFIHKGNGPNEFIDLSQPQIYIENGDTMGLLTSPSKEKLIKWNISQSILKNRTILETLEFKWSDEYLRPPGYTALIDDNLLITSITEDFVFSDGKRSTLESFYKIDLSTKQIVDIYHPFHRPINNDNPRFYANGLYYADVISLSPDRKKLVSVFSFFDQINIMNTASGNFEGYRVSGSPNYRDIETNMGDFTLYYCDVESDNDYIYTLRKGEPVNKNNLDLTARFLYLYNWEGELIKGYYLDQKITSMSLDREAGNLIFRNDYFDELFILPIYEILNSTASE